MRGYFFKDAREFEKELKDNINQYHGLIKGLGIHLYKKYQNNPEEAGLVFLKTILLPWILYLEPNLISDQRETSNKGSGGGFVTEKVFFNIINSAIEIENLSEKIKAANTYRYFYNWKENASKKRENSPINIDIGVSLIADNRLLYCLEIKTNFKNNFKKYYEERIQIIEHEKQNNRPLFPYHYVCFSEREHKFSKECADLDKVQQLWEFPKDWFLKDRKANDFLSDNEPQRALIIKASKFLNAIYAPIISAR